MTRMRRDEEIEGREHYRTAGSVVLAFGVFGLVLAGLKQTTDFLAPSFLSPLDIAVVSGAMLAVGFMMFQNRG